MNALKYAAYGLGGTTLLAGSFVLFTAISGTPLSDVKGMSKIFPEEPKAEVVEPGGGTIEEQLEGDTRSSEQVFDAAASPLSAFQMPAPVSAEELGTLENRLLMREEELNRRERMLADREALIARDEEYLKDRWQELARLQAAIVEESSEAIAEKEETAARDSALSQKTEATFKQMAPLFADGEPEVIWEQLATWFEPADAAKVLKHLPEDRVAEIFRAMHGKQPEQAKRYGLAYRLEMGE